MKRILLILTVMAFFHSLSIQAQTKEITVNGTKRNYIVYVPQNLGEKRPLFISCRLSGQRVDESRHGLCVEKKVLADGTVVSRVVRR